MNDTFRESVWSDFVRNAPSPVRIADTSSVSLPASTMKIETALLDATVMRLSLCLQVLHMHDEWLEAHCLWGACLARLCTDLPSYDGAKDDDHSHAGCLSQQTPNSVRACASTFSSLRSSSLDSLRPIESPILVSSRCLVFTTIPSIHPAVPALTSSTFLLGLPLRHRRRQHTSQKFARCSGSHTCFNI